MFKLSKETCSITLVAHAWPNRLYAHEKCVGIAIDTDLAHFQQVPAGLAFSPQPVARTAEENCLLRPLCLGQSLFVHEPQHQHFIRSVVLNDGRNQPVAFIECNFHRASFFKTTSKTKSPLGLFAPAGR
jgi:hypothetical protein